MNGRLSIVGLLLVTGATVAVVLGWRRGNGVVFVIGALMLAVAAWNVGVYVMGKRR
jgi:hypothetical protein